MNQLLVGIDVSKNTNAIYIMKPDGSKHSSFSVSNNLNGAKVLTDRVVKALNDLGMQGVKLGMEATSVYGDNLARYLRSDDALCRYDRKVMMLNPKQVKKTKDTFNDLPKNDPTDAFVVAEVLRNGRIGHEIPSDDRFAALQVLTRGRYQNLKGKNVILNIFPSLDTSVCATSVRKFNTMAAGLKDTFVLAISKDLPFAHGRFCTTEGIENVIIICNYLMPVKVK